jgi:ABC-type transport system involved in multi-copper enzyme maturation permease subunit
MKPLAALTLSGFRHTYRSRAAVVIFLSLGLMIVGLLVYFGIRYMLRLADDESRIHLFGLILYSSSLVVLGLNFNVFTSRALVREKTQRILDSVLACPVSARQVWIAKVLAVLVPGVVMSTAVTLAIGLALAHTTPELGTTAMADPWVILAGFVWIPLIYLSIALLCQALGLSGNPIVANIIPQVFLPLAANVVMTLGVRSLFETNSWLFSLGNLLLVVGCGAAGLVVGRKLSAERIVLPTGAR